MVYYKYVRRSMHMKDKNGILKKNGTYNKGSGSVTAEEFQGGIFFDPNDLVQVKYEMLRSVAKNKMSVSEASKMYGLSRQSYYINKTAVDDGGIAALIPQKTGPRKAYKLTDRGCQFIDSYICDHPDANTHQVNKALYEATGISVHDRTVTRYLLSKKTLSSR